MTGFNGYAFNKAHSTAYGVEAYQAAWLKRYYPAEFMAGVLTNGKGFYAPLVYVLECHRLGIRLLRPDVNAPGPGFLVEGRAIRVPVSAIKGLTDRFVERLHTATGAFASLTDFSERVRPSAEEVELLIRAGVFDGLGLPRTRLFWEAQVCSRRGVHTQAWLLPPPPLDQLAGLTLAGPGRQQRLESEQELFD